MWAFVERIGVTGGLTVAQVGSALSFSMLGGLLGALFVASQGGKWGRLKPLWLSGGLFVVVAFGYLLETSWYLFAGLTFLFSFAWNNPDR